ncbi:MAG: helix-turn-helix transcriptional regulator [Patescibacteria group bacterium]
MFCSILSHVTGEGFFISGQSAELRTVEVSPNEDIFADVPRTPHLRLVEPILVTDTLVTPQHDPFELVDDEANVLFLTARGGKTEEIASMLAADMPEIEATQEALMEKFNAPNLPSVVNRAAVRKILEVEVETDPSVRLSSKERKIIRLIAAGHQTQTIANHFGKNREAIRTSKKPLFGKLGVRGASHAIYRSHELGIIK